MVRMSIETQKRSFPGFIRFQNYQMLLKKVRGCVRLTCRLEHAWVALTVSRSKRLHHPINLLGLAGQPEAPQKLSSVGNKEINQGVLTYTYHCMSCSSPQKEPGKQTDVKLCIYTHVLIKWSDQQRTFMCNTCNGQIKKQSLTCWVILYFIIIIFNFCCLLYLHTILSDAAATITHNTDTQQTKPLPWSLQLGKIKDTRKTPTFLCETDDMMCEQSNIFWLKGLFPASAWLRKQTSHLKACTRFRSANSWSSTKACRTLMLKSSLRRRRKEFQSGRAPPPSFAFLKASNGKLPREH